MSGAVAAPERQNIVFDRNLEEKEVEGKMSKGQIKKDLDAVNEDEKNILLKIAKQKGKKKGDNNTKDW